MSIAARRYRCDRHLCDPWVSCNPSATSSTGTTPAISRAPPPGNPPPLLEGHCIYLYREAMRYGPRTTPVKTDGPAVLRSAVPTKTERRNSSRCAAGRGLEQ